MTDGDGDGDDRIVAGCLFAIALLTMMFYGLGMMIGAWRR